MCTGEFLRIRRKLCDRQLPAAYYIVKDKG